VWVAVRGGWVQNVEIRADPAVRSTLCTDAVQNVEASRLSGGNSTFCSLSRPANHTPNPPADRKSSLRWRGRRAKSLLELLTQ